MLAQLEMDCLETVFSLAAMVERDKCPQSLEEADLRRLLPQAAPLFDDQRIQIEVVVVAERAPVLRVPATERKLPPTEWEQAYLPRTKVLVLLHVRRRSEGTMAGAEPAVPTGRWIRGTLPGPEPSGLELLRLEL